MKLPPRTPEAQSRMFHRGRLGRAFWRDARARQKDAARAELVGENSNWMQGVTVDLNENASKRRPQ